MKWTAALTILTLIGAAEAQEKTIDEIFPHTVQITDGISDRCRAAWPNNEDESNACWNAQAQAFASVANFAPIRPGQQLYWNARLNMTPGSRSTGCRQSNALKDSWVS